MVEISKYFTQTSFVNMAVNKCVYFVAIGLFVGENKVEYKSWLICNYAYLPT